MNKIIRIVLTVLCLSFVSYKASAAVPDVKVCKTCISDDSFYSFAKQHHKFMSTVWFHVYNPNTDVLKQFKVTNRQEILPNGEPLFHTTAAMYNPDSDLRADVTTFVQEKDRIGDDVISAMKLSLDIKDYYIKVPESIAKSPWDLVDRSYKMTQLREYIDPGVESSFWWQELGDSFGAQAYVYVSMAFNIGLTELVGFESLRFNTATLIFESGATITFEYSFLGKHYFDLSLAVDYPILDSDGNVVANSASELKSSTITEGDYLFSGSSGGGIDRSAFESMVERAGFEVISNGVYSDGAVIRCYNVYVDGVYMGPSCVKL
ncbi:hypothetical protein [Vibrio alfacsensis]|uniref:hypothetical protein n=1 Tax=Vibrio alfacsensis TaxID=1074311 RepID=UPI0040687897